MRGWGGLGGESLACPLQQQHPDASLKGNGWSMEIVAFRIAWSRSRAVLCSVSPCRTVRISACKHSACL